MQEQLEQLKSIPPIVVRKAWFTLAHLLLDPGSKVAIMGCNDGDMAYAMAIMNPALNFIGVDKSRKKINKAQTVFRTPNLEFVHGDITKPVFGENSLDAIVNSYILYEVFSHSKYSERAVRQALRTHFSMLKTGGIMFIQDYARPPPEEFVQLEMPDVASKGKELEDLSEADLLVWFSEHARPNPNDPISAGFYLEELPARFPKTRLFRLPYKWAYEFIMRKDDRENWQADLFKEYTYFTKREFRKELRALGSRVLYSAPHWDDSIIKNRFEGHFRLYGENGTPLGAPPTSFVAVAQKLGEHVSLTLKELRPAKEKDSHIRITAMRNEVDGRIVDIVSRDAALTEIIPYRIADQNRLHIFVHEGVPRSIVNAIPRHGDHLDGKRWSGHMTEAIAVDTNAVHKAEIGGHKEIIKFSMYYLGLKPAIGTTFEEGPAYYPAPDFINERIETRYLRIESGLSAPIAPKHVPEDINGFSTQGRIRELDAQDVLNALSVGLIPNARLETQILALYQHLGIKPVTWNECPLTLDIDPEANETVSVQDLLGKMAGDDKRFKDVKGTAGDVRVIHSIFVDEGYDNGGMTGLASRDMDFVISDETTINKAIILPLTRNISGEVMVGVTTEYQPVPQRYKGNGLTVSAPCLTLPKDITNIEMAKKYIAMKFETDIEKVARMGESFLCHSGLTPQRIYPFVVAKYGLPKWIQKGRGMGVTAMMPIKTLWKMLYWDSTESFLRTVGKAYTTMQENNDLSFNYSFSMSMASTKSIPIAMTAGEIVGNAASYKSEIQSIIFDGARSAKEHEILKKIEQLNQTREPDGFKAEPEEPGRHGERSPTLGYE